MCERPTTRMSLPAFSSEMPIEQSDIFWRDDEIAFLKDLLFTPRAGASAKVESLQVQNEATPLPVVVKPARAVAKIAHWTEVASPVPTEAARDNTRATQRPSLKRSRSALSPLSDGKRHRARLNTLKQPVPSAFKTLSSTQCLQHIHKSFELLTQAKRDLMKEKPSQAPESAMALNGWQLRCPTAQQLAARQPRGMPTYLLSKKFPQQSVQELMHNTWQLWTDPTALMKMYPSRKFTLQILQRFNGDGLIVQQDSTELADHMNLRPTRSIYMLFRIETKQGFTICARSLDSTAGFHPPVFHWITFFTDGDAPHVTAEFGACVQTPFLPSNEFNASYRAGEALKQAIRQHLLALFQWEAMVSTPFAINR